MNQLLLRIGDFVAAGASCGKVTALKQDLYSARRPNGGAIEVIIYNTDDDLNPTEPSTGKKIKIDSYDVPEFWSTYRARNLQYREMRKWNEREDKRRAEVKAYGTKLLKALGLSETYVMETRGTLAVSGPYDVDTQLAKSLNALCDLAKKLNVPLPSGYDKLAFEPHPKPSVEVEV